MSGLPHRANLALMAVLATSLVTPAVASDEAKGLTGGALAGERPRVIVSTDIGGADPDDFQSMVHLFLYADVLDLEGLISSPPDAGRARHLHETIDAYAQDFGVLHRQSRKYPTPDFLHGLVTQGAVDASPKQGWSKPTDGSRQIVERAHGSDKRPLWVLVWGSITDVAQAVHDDPTIKERIRVYSIGSWNTRHDQAARDYLYDHHADLWWIESDTTFRGMYMGGRQDGEWGNRPFVERYVKNHGALGNFYFAKKPDIKMGDTPSLLYLFRGDPDEPTAPHWGGAFRKTDHGPNYWTDDPNPALAEGDRPGAKTVNCWRCDYLQDWRERMAVLGAK